MPRRIPGTPAASSADLYWVSGLLGSVDWSSVATRSEIAGLRERVRVLADVLDAREQAS
jgi:hypothetical protein